MRINVFELLDQLGIDVGSSSNLVRWLEFYFGHADSAVKPLTK